MAVATATELTRKRCAPCEGGVPPLSRDHVADLLKAVPGWKLSADGQAIRKEWRVKDFTTALDFFHRIGQVAEQEDHHPDLHLEGYRNVTIALSTHAVKGLTENDFILAAKINEVPVQVRR